VYSELHNVCLTPALPLTSRQALKVCRANIEQDDPASCKRVRVSFCSRTEMGCNEFTSDKDSTQSQVLASYRYVEDLAKDCQFQGLSKAFLRLPVVHFRNGIILDIWHTVWCCPAIVFW
jgi:hypothetical protein